MPPSLYLEKGSGKATCFCAKIPVVEHGRVEEGYME
jgi:hypothetical protein